MTSRRLGSVLSAGETQPRRGLFTASGPAILLMVAGVVSPHVARADDGPAPRDAERRLVVSGQGYFPVALKLHDGRIAIVLRGGAAHVGIKGRLDLVTSADRGKTWSAPAVVVDSPADDRNPAFGQAADGALVIAFWRAARDSYEDFRPESIADPDRPVGTWVTRSTDGGKTWGEPAEIDVREIGYGSPYGRILTLPDGAMLMNVYGHGVRAAGEKPTAEIDHSYLYRSTDGGRTWSRFSLIGKGFNETGLLPLPDDGLLAAMRSAGGDASVSITRSADSGRTWSEPERVTGPATHPADLVRLANGRVLMTTGFRAGPFGVRGAVGDSDGRFDWTKSFTLVDDSTNTDTGYPSNVVLDGGRVLTVYYAVGSKTRPDWGTHCGGVEYTPSR